MRPSPWIVALRVAALLALAASAALYIDYTTVQPLFCGAGSGCAAVRRSGFGYVPLAGTYVPVPVFGLLGFAALFGASLIPRLALRSRALRFLGAGAGAIALVLIYLQFTLHTFCSLCLVADSAALVCAVAAFAYHRALAHDGASHGELLKTWAWGVLSALAVAAPFVWPSVRPLPPIPDKVRALYVPNKINVVEFADFQCPFCRELHGRLKPLLEEYGDRLHVVRLNFPLESHPFARGAARAAVCAAAQGKGDAMADRLFGAEDLTMSANRQLAVELGLDMQRYDSCIADPATDRKIDAQKWTMDADHFQGLPTTFIGDRELVGAQPTTAFKDALEHALRDERNLGLPATRFGLIVVALALAVAALGRARNPAS